MQRMATGLVRGLPSFWPTPTATTMTSAQTTWKPLYQITPDPLRVARMHRFVSARQVGERPDWIRLDAAARAACPVYRMNPERNDLPSWEL